MKRVKAQGIDVIVYEPLLNESSFHNFKVIKDIEHFKKTSDLIICK